MTTLILGPDLFLQEQALTRAIAELRRAGEITIERHDAAEFSISHCVEALQHLSMWGGRPVHIVRYLKQWDWAAADRLIAYLKSPNPEASLILVADSLDGRIKAVQEIKKLCKVIECKPPAARQLPEYLREQAKGLGKQLSMEAANWCLELVGQDLATLHRAMEGLALFVGTKPLIDLADVEKFLAATSQRGIFELTNALGEGKKEQALSLLRNLLHHGEAAVFINHMIARHFRILLALASSAGADQDAVLRDYKIPPFFAQEYLRQAKKWPARRLLSGMVTLARTDRALKSSRLDDGLIQDLTLLKL